MKMLGYLVVIIETFDPVGFEIPVQIMKAGDLVATGHVDDAVYDFQAQGLEKPGADSSPGQFLGNLLKPPSTNQSVPHPSADGRPVGIVRKKSNPPSLIQEFKEFLFLVGDGQGVDGKGVFLVPLFPFRGHDLLAETGRLALGQGEGIGRFGQQAGDTVAWSAKDKPKTKTCLGRML